jgi:L-lactate dehydrogenase complex protein LldG
MSARDRILTRVRRGADATRPPGADRNADVAARLGSAGIQHAPIPAGGRTEGADRLARFTTKLTGVDSTWSMAPDMASIPALLADLLRARNLPVAVRMGADPDLTGLDWSGLDASFGVGRLVEPATLSRARVASAETGTLALYSGPDNPVTLTFLGEIHFVAIRASEIKAGLDDVWTHLRASGQDPRTVNLVTGPSRSADIGQMLQLGAHGPVAMHIFIVED